MTMLQKIPQTGDVVVVGGKKDEHCGNAGEEDLESQT